MVTKLFTLSLGHFTYCVVIVYLAIQISSYCTWYMDYIPCTGKYHESAAVLTRVAMQQQIQTSDIASTQCVICLSYSYHSNIHGCASTLAIGCVLANENLTAVSLCMVGLGELCSKIRPLCYAPVLPTNDHYPLGWVLLCSINRLFNAWNTISN